MKEIKVDQKELEYWCTLDWDPLMSYLEKKYGIEFKNEVKKRIACGMKKNYARKKIRRDK